MSIESADIDSTSPIPLFLQIRLRLLTEILNWPDPKTRFYGDNELAERFEVSRMTVRQAIAGLVSEGLLRRRSGQGTFVTDRVFLERLDPTLDIAGQYAEAGVEQRVELLEFSFREATSVECDGLDLESGEGVLFIRRLRAIGSSPLAVDERTLPEKLARSAGFDEVSVKGSFVERLRGGIHLGTASWTVGAGRAGELLARLLYLDVTDPVLERRMTYRSSAGRRVLTGRTAHRADMVRYHFDLPLDGTCRIPTETTHTSA